MMKDDPTYHLRMEGLAHAVTVVKVHVRTICASFSPTKGHTEAAMERCRQLLEAVEALPDRMLLEQLDPRMIEQVDKWIVKEEINYHAAEVIEHCEKVVPKP